MIQKIHNARNFKEPLDYAVEKEKAEVLTTNMGGNTPSELAAEFNAIARIKPNYHSPCVHVKFSLPNRGVFDPRGEYRENVDNDTAIEMLQRWMKGMGFLKFTGADLDSEINRYKDEKNLASADSQYVIIRHNDTQHNHFHLITSRIALDGKVVDNSWDYYRGQKIVRKLELDYNLEPTPCSNDSIANELKLEGIPAQVNSLRRSEETQRESHHTSGEPSRRRKLQNAIDEATEDNPTVTQLIARLQRQNINPKPVFTKSGDFREAIAYCIEGIHFAGYKLGAAYSFPGLQKHRGVDYNFERDMEALQKAAQGIIVEVTKEEPKSSVNIEKEPPLKPTSELESADDPRLQRSESTSKRDTASLTTPNTGRHTGVRENFNPSSGAINTGGDDSRRTQNTSKRNTPVTKSRKALRDAVEKFGGEDRQSDFKSSPHLSSESDTGRSKSDLNDAIERFVCESETATGTIKPDRESNKSAPSVDEKEFIAVGSDRGGCGVDGSDNRVIDETTHGNIINTTENPGKDRKDGREIKQHRNPIETSGEELSLVDKETVEQILREAIALVADELEVNKQPNQKIEISPYQINWDNQLSELSIVATDRGEILKGFLGRNNNNQLAIQVRSSQILPHDVENLSKNLQQFQQVQLHQQQLFMKQQEEKRQKEKKQKKQVDLEY